MTAPERTDERAALVARLHLQQVYTPTEAAVLLGWSRSWVEARCKSGELPARRSGSRWLLTRADLIASGWLAAPPNAEASAGAACCAKLVNVRGWPGWIEPTPLFLLAVLPPASRRYGSQGTPG